MKSKQDPNIEIQYDFEWSTNIKTQRDFEYFFTNKLKTFILRQFENIK